VDEQTRDAETTPEGTAPASADPPAKAPRKRASRKKAVAPQQAPPAATEPAADAVPAQDETAQDQTAQDQTAPDEAAPAARTPRKRASRKKAVAPQQAPPAATEVAADTPPEQAPSVDAVAEPVVDAPTEAATDAAPRTRRKRGRATRPAAAPAAAEGVEAEQTEATAPAAQIEPVPAAAPGEPVEDGTEDETEDETAEGGSPEEQATGLLAPLFQAPQPRRRRAATRPAGAPAPASQDEPVASEQPAAPAQDEEAQAAPSTGRRRRSRSRGAAAQEVVPDEDARTDDAPAEATGEDADPDTQDDSGEEQDGARRKRRRGGRGRRRRGGDDDGGTADASTDGGGDASDDDAPAEQDEEQPDDGEQAEEGGSSRRRRRRRRRSGGGEDGAEDDPPNTVTRVRASRTARDEVVGVKGSTRLEAKRQRRREGRESGRRKQVITEAEFLARREAVERTMIVRSTEGRTQIVVLEDGVLVEHYVARKAAASMIGNVYTGKVQNVLPSMEAAFVDIGKGRNAVLYAGEVNWDAAGLEGQPRRIELALKSGDPVLVQVSKDPVGHKGARLTSQVSLPGRYLVYVPNSSMTGISRKLPDTERSRLKKILKAVVPDHAGVIVRTAAEGASEVELERDVQRLQAQWERIEKKAKAVNPPTLLHAEPDLTTKVVRDVFNEDFASLVVSGEDAWDTVKGYVDEVAPDLSERVTRWDGDGDVFAAHRVDEQISKALDRKVFLPSGGSLVIDRTEAMTVVDVNTGKFVGSGGNLEETVTRNNLEAAEEIVRQLRLRDVGGIIVIDFIDMVLESNRDLVLRRLTECLGRDRTKHQVAEVTSLGLVQMTRKRVGQGLLEAFSEPCEHCQGSGVTLHDEPIERKGGGGNGGGGDKADKDPAKAEQARRASAEAHKVHEAARKAMERAKAGTDGDDAGTSDPHEVAEEIVAEVVAEVTGTAPAEQPSDAPDDETSDGSSDETGDGTGDEPSDDAAART
jgi:ribonuclease E